MAVKFKPDKKGVIKGTKKKDTITWSSSKDWQRDLTVNAAAGNDIINFKKSKYKNKLNGEAGNDTIYGGTNIDTIKGGTGNDKLYGYNGNDIIYAGEGNDNVWGGNGNDTIYGQSGTNTLRGEDGADKIYAGTGKDTIYAGAGNDTIDLSKGGANTVYLESGNNQVSKGGAGVDKIYGGTGNDTIYAGAGNDTIDLSKGGKNIVFAEAGADIIKGGAGDDVINAGKGNDTISGGAGSNTFVFSLGDGKDVITDAKDGDIIKLEFDLMDSTNFSVADGKLVITFDENNSITTNFDYLSSQSNIDAIYVKDENSEGGYRQVSILGDIIFDKVLSENENYVKLTPYIERITFADTATNATVSNLGEKDFVYLGDDCEDDATCVGNAVTFSFADGNKSVTISDFFNDDGDIVAKGGLYIDGTAVYGKYEQVALSDIDLDVSERNKFSNIVNVEEQEVSIFHSVHIDGTNEADTFTGGAGNDSINGNAGTDTINGGDGDDTIYGGDDGDYIYGGDGDDTIYGENGYDHIYGGAGDDTIYGGGSNNDIYTGIGDDTVNAGAGWNTVFLDAGDKKIEHSHGNEDILVFLNETNKANLKGYVSGNDLVVADSTGTSARLLNYFTEGHSVKAFNVHKKSIDKLVIEDLPIVIESSASEINGTNLNDIITATNNNGVVINGYEGKDTIYDGAGNDIIYGGQNDDTIYSRSGNDTINAGTGTNTIVVNTGNKIIENGDGVDTVVFNLETNLDNLKRHISGNNLVVTDSEGNSVTLLDYFQNSHSVRTVKVGNKIRDIDEVSIQAPNNYIVGTRNNDTLNGSINDDVIYGCTGNDTINGDAGNDIIIGGTGNDIINGDAGNDTLVGNAGTDTINGGDGDDVIDGGTGDDIINGGAGNNIIYLDAGDKIIENGGGVDTIVFNNETNIDNLRGRISDNDLVITDSTGTSVTLTNYFVSGHSVSIIKVGYMTINIADLPVLIESNASEINGTNLKDIITATNNNGATINGYAGKDIINGSIGPDTIYGNEGDDTIIGGAGIDKLYGENGDDIIYGNEGDDIIFGNTGNDSLYGGEGNDIIYSGDDSDFISGGAGDNKIYLNMGNKTIANGGGNDTLIFVNETNINNIEVTVSGNNLVLTDDSGTTATLLNYSDGHSVSTIEDNTSATKNINDLTNYIESAEETINGTFFHDNITATSAGFQLVYGREGNDIIYGGDWNNVIYGDDNLAQPTYAGNDIIYGGGGQDQLFGGLGDDEIHGGIGNDDVYGQGGDDTLYGDGGDDNIFGGWGDDEIHGGADNDIIDGGTGDDEIHGDAGNDDIEGGSGSDILYGDDGNDIIKGSDGNDILYGGAGNDTYIQKENDLSYYDEIYDESGENDSLEINNNKSDIILRCDVEIDEEGHIIEENSKNMYITYTANFGNAEKGVKVTDQFVDGHSIEKIKTADNYTLMKTQINSLRSTIATWLSNSPYDSVQAVIDSGDETAIANLILEFQNANWQPPQP